MTKFQKDAWFNATNNAVEMTKTVKPKAEKEISPFDAIVEIRDWLYSEHMEFFKRENNKEK